GYFTCLMLTKNGKYFKAGVSVAPVTDFRLYDTAYTERSMGLPQENKSGYDSTNVMTWMNRMKGSILLIHAIGDDNVHSQNTTHFVQSALRAGKDVEWLIYPNRNHGIYGGGAREHLYKKMIDFFNEKL
ncbi:MAG: prolyl oligopeptidase family serine peptidase, partial [Candidatus Marinimicrobia bacterium]|nr:prolyl oligopeptidase family serine peptidase [Candidatus Neomarinimicrobiota bacterium]